MSHLRKWYISPLTSGSGALLPPSAPSTTQLRDLDIIAAVRFTLSDDSNGKMSTIPIPITEFGDPRNANCPISSHLPLICSIQVGIWRVLVHTLLVVCSILILAMGPLPSTPFLPTSSAIVGWDWIRTYLHMRDEMDGCMT